MRKLQIAFIVICLLLSAMIFSACNVEETSYFVGFVDEDGYTQVSPTQCIVAGKKFTIPQEQKKEGKVFVGWVLRGEEDIYDFSIVNSTVVNYDMMFVAKYKNTVQEHVITFLMEDESTVISKQVVNHGQSFYVPNVDATNINGFRFLGWLRQVTAGWSSDVYDFPTKGLIADRDMTFKAKYENAVQEHVITFLMEDESTVISKQVVNHGQSFYIPNVDATNNNGFRFLGWLRQVTAGWSSDVYDFPTKGLIADRDMTFKAYYPFANVVMQTESGQILKSDKISLSDKVNKPHNSDDTLWQSFRVMNSDGTISNEEFDFEKPITIDTTIIVLECRRALNITDGVVVKNASDQVVVNGSYLKKNEVYSVSFNDDLPSNDTLLSVAVKGKLLGDDDLPMFKVNIISTNNMLVDLCIDGHAMNCSVLNGTSTYQCIVNKPLSLSITKEKLDYQINPASATKSANEADQNVLYDNGVFYRPLWTKKTATWVIAYGTDLNEWGSNDAWQYKSVVDLNAVFGDRYVQDDWAPDLIKFNGKYYITGTVGLNDYTSSYNKTFYRTIVIFEADSPLGEYKLISKKNTAKDTAILTKNRNGRVTPQYGTELGGMTTAGWDSIDSTIYIENGIPYLLWSDEWTNYSGNGNKGNYYYAKLTDDLSMLAEKPKLIFAPSSFVSAHKTTDSIWLHKTKIGDLIAIYTTFDSNNNYCVHYARSSNDSITGSWTYVGVIYDKTNANLALIAPDTGEVAVGGHANIFETIDGQLYLSLHLHQNDADGAGTGGWRCPSIIALREEGQHGSVKLVWGLNSEKNIVRPAGTTLEFANGFSTARAAFSVSLDDNSVVGVKLMSTIGITNTITIDKFGNVYVNNSKVTSVSTSKLYSVVLNVKSDMSLFELSINGTDISSFIKSELGSNAINTILLYDSLSTSGQSGQVAYSQIELETTI